MTDQEQAFAALRRINSALAKWGVLPSHSLQYRLGETGQPRVHIEPRLLARTLASLKRPEAVPLASHPWELADQLFACAEFNAEEAQRETGARKPDLKVIADAGWHEGFTDLVSSTAEALGDSSVLQPVREISCSVLAGNTTVPAYDSLIQTKGSNGTRIDVWMVQGSDWIHPDDWRLWNFLATCENADTRPIILARRLHPGLFALFKALDLRGLQTHAMVAREEEHADVAPAAERLGWFLTRHNQQLVSKGPFSALKTSVDYLSETRWTQSSRTALARALALGLHEPSSRAAERLAEWTRSSPLADLESWSERVFRWADWETNPPEPLEPEEAGDARQRRSRSEQDRAAGPPRSIPRSGTPSPKAPVEQRTTTVTRVPVRGY